MHTAIVVVLGTLYFAVVIIGLATMKASSLEACALLEREDVYEMEQRLGDIR